MRGKQRRSRWTATAAAAGGSYPRKGPGDSLQGTSPFGASEKVGEAGAHTLCVEECTRALWKRWAVLLVAHETLCPMGMSSYVPLPGPRLPPPNMYCITFCACVSSTYRSVRLCVEGEVAYRSFHLRFSHCTVAEALSGYRRCRGDVCWRKGGGVTTASPVPNVGWSPENRRTTDKTNGMRAIAK